MNLKNFFWYFPSAIDSTICKKLIQLDKRKFQRGYTADKQLAVAELKKTRNSHVKFSNNKWVFDLVNSYMDQANKNAEWNFQTNWIESFQITRYAKNEFYDWHVDQKEDPYPITAPNKNYRGKMRKLSLTINLSDPMTYKGGRLQFEFSKTSRQQSVIRECVEARAQGSVIVFPSFVLHRVTPVTEGVRYSLVAWFLGEPFR